MLLGATLATLVAVNPTIDQCLTTSKGWRGAAWRKRTHSVPSLCSLREMRVSKHVVGRTADFKGQRLK
jgi:hypothetical protein